MYIMGFFRTMLYSKHTGRVYSDH